MNTDSRITPVLDLFAGPGGWSQALRARGLREVGIEIDPVVCATRAAVGHATIRADVAAYPTAPLRGKITGLIGSPPCQTFSAAGLRAGTTDLPLCHQALDDLAQGHDTRDTLREACTDSRSLLVVEPLRYCLDLRPDWIALEEVPAVKPVFEHTARLLAEAGYSTWTGVLNAADFGLAQTRRRAILIASRIHPALPPQPTHADGGTPADLFGDSLPAWVSMAQALGLEPGVTVATRGNRKTTGGNKFHASRPSWALTEKARSWVLHSRRDSPNWIAAHGARTNRHGDQPAPSITGEAHRWHWQRDDVYQRPLGITEAAALQGFPATYPWAGSRTKQFQQIGNAVPPPLATAVLTTLVPAASEVAA
ncbi:DNA cytosine methyltransferase [Streptomyces sp. NPDC005426]|uniref:DNA cytosine methyltransferase n=1 Tax=Streptomyces sp. NPDC005426 TaxID=3155344 RepID=UPI0033BEEBE9